MLDYKILVFLVLSCASSTYSQFHDDDGKAEARINRFAKFTDIGGLESLNEDTTENEASQNRPFFSESETVQTNQEEDGDEEEIPRKEPSDTEDSPDSKPGVYDFLYRRLKQEAIPKKRQPANVYMIPGPQEPLPGRSHIGDYWPVFPFQNQYSGGLDLDPSIARHIGGDMNLAVPSWGMLDISGRFFNRIPDTTTKFGYMNHPVNMMDLEKEDFVKLMSDPSLHFNRNAQPRIPLGKFAKTYVPISCKAPMCNPYHNTFAFGMEHDYGGNDGVEGDIDVPIPISKGIAYRFPFSGKVYYHFDNITVSYGHNLAPVEPFSSLFDYQKYRDPRLRIPRARRDVVSLSQKVWSSEPTAKTFGDHVTGSPSPRARRVEVSTHDQYVPQDLWMEADNHVSSSSNLDNGIDDQNLPIRHQAFGFPTFNQNMAPQFYDRSPIPYHGELDNYVEKSPNWMSQGGETLFGDRRSAYQSSGTFRVDPLRARILESDPRIVRGRLTAAPTPAYTIRYVNVAVPVVVPAATSSFLNQGMVPLPQRRNTYPTITVPIRARPPHNQPQTEFGAAPRMPYLGFPLAMAMQNIEQMALHRNSDAKFL